MTETQFNTRMAAISKPASVFNWRKQPSSTGAALMRGLQAPKQPAPAQYFALSTNVPHSINTEARDGKVKQRVKAHLTA